MHTPKSKENNTSIETLKEPMPMVGYADNSGTVEATDYSIFNAPLANLSDYGELNFVIADNKIYFPINDDQTPILTDSLISNINNNGPVSDNANDHRYFSDLEGYEGLSIIIQNGNYETMSVGW